MKKTTCQPFGNSYWATRRRIHANVASHMKFVQNEVHPEIISNNPTCVTSEAVTIEPEQMSDLVQHSSHAPVIAAVQHCPDLHNMFHECDSDEVDDNYCQSQQYSTSSSDYEILNDDDLDVGLHEWSMKHGITMSALQDLLGILKRLHPQLPSDPRTLRRTCRNISVKELSHGGSYYHFGIASGIQRLFAAGFITSPGTLSLQFNVDGLPIFKSSAFQLWPILMIVKESSNADPVSVGLYGGNSKPSDVSEYLDEFVTEMKYLLADGITLGGVKIYIKIHSFVCDAPARSYLKRTKPFNGYSGCERCVQVGLWKGRITYPDTNAQLRTDGDFEAMNDEDYHCGRSPLHSLGFGMVSKFPLDYLHLVCLGVMRRLLLAWIRGPLHCRLPARAVQKISDKLLQCRTYIPCEFARKPRSLSEIDRWKATEFRQFLLYTGPVVLKGILPVHLLNHFLVLSVAIRLLLSSSMCSYYCDYAQKLLITFVQQADQLYGTEFLVYNVHSLIHIADDARLFGPLDNVSSFPFENYLQYIKKLVKSARQPLMQVIRRIIEQQYCSANSVTSNDTCLKHCHSNGPLPENVMNAEQFAKVNTSGFEISLKTDNNCVLLQNDEVGLVRNILQVDSSVFLVCNMFKTAVDFFDLPLPSSHINIYKVTHLASGLKMVPIKDVHSKCVILPLEGISLVAFVLLHNGFSA